MTIERMRDIHAFVHVAEAKSFTAAAERIGLSRSATEHDDGRAYAKPILESQRRFCPPAAAGGGFGVKPCTQASRAVSARGRAPDFA
jgi:hypothetical protein